MVLMWVGDNNDVADVDESFNVNNKRKKKDNKVSLVIPANAITKATSQVADRIGLSVRGHLLLQSRLVNIGGAELGQFSLSTSTVWRQRTCEREKLAKEIMENWLKEKPKYAVIHWDSKMIEFVTGKKEERVAIIVSGANSG